ncbi:hypothetical protein AWZ03_000509 [Drosophila navojoa]|uniref:Uncharacterized protein n=1 Tax=Drosophila navojoa TaxID=7232 RepID=A0A484BVW9_DRONA|nr:hypothetical protein AWZ03_000509 [Drosophila navojoa]
MYGFRCLTRCMRRRHGTVATVIAALALLTYFLKQNYESDERDLLYWREVVLLSSRHPCLMAALVATVLCPLLTMALIQQRLIRTVEGTVSRMRRRNRRRQFADFIVRRLLLQLELAMLRMPRKLRVDQQLNDPRARMRCEMAKEAAYRAVDIFRRDAAALLFKHRRRSLDEATFVLDEEELMLLHGGYGHIDLRVSCQLLRRLLYPQAMDRPQQLTRAQTRDVSQYQT